MLNLTNVRVRIALVNALVVSILMYGSVLFACLGNSLETLQSGNTDFQAAEIFVRRMLRWATRMEIDTRCSVMYVVSNCENV
jgi:hypothetical protein